MRLSSLSLFVPALALAAPTQAGAQPSSPQHLSVLSQAASDSAVTLTWDPPAKGTASAYLVFADGRPAGETSRSYFTADGLEAGRKHSFSIEARDAAGSLSPASATVKGSTRRVGARLTVTAFGARGDGRTKDTAAIQRAIKACPAGGTVEVPAGTFLTGALYLKSDLTLLLDPGAVLQGSVDPADYKPWIRNRFEGWELDTFASLINAGRLDHAGPPNVRNIAIRGQGTIRGGGATLGQAMIAAGGIRARGRLICVMNCEGLDIQGVTLENPPAWTVHFIYSENVSCRDLNIRNRVENGDGIDPDSSRDCDILNCTFATGDDCIAIKSGKNPEGFSIGRPTENVRITDCNFVAGHGIAIGSEMSGGVRNVLVRDCNTGKLLDGLEIKGTKERGGNVEGVRVENCRLRMIRILARVGYNNDGAAAPSQPNFSDFTFSNIDMGRAEVDQPVILVQGFPAEGHRTRGVLFRNIRLPDGAAIALDRCEQFKFVRVLTSSGAKPVYKITDSRDIDY